MTRLLKKGETHYLKYTPDELKKKFKLFQEYCKKNDVPMTMGRLCVILDVDKDYLNDRSKDGKYSEQIRRMRHIILAEKEEWLCKGKGSTVGLIFYLKNNNHWHDRQEIEHKGDLPVQIVFAQEKNKIIDVTPKPKEIKEVINGKD